MPIPPRVSVVALRTVDLARSTAFYVALGWELSAASTAAMSLFKTAGSLLLVCTDDPSEVERIVVECYRKNCAEATRRSVARG